MCIYCIDACIYIYIYIYVYVCLYIYAHVQYFVYPIVYSAFIIVAKKLYGQYLFIHIPLQSVPPTNQKNTVKKN